MNRQQISDFLKKAYSKKEFKFKYGSNRQCEGSPAAVDNNNTIWINRFRFKYYKPIEQKGILLHEIGHVLIGRLQSEVNSELWAHIIAIKLAKKNKWKKIQKELEKTITDWVTDYKWNEQNGVYRKYILAGRKYLCQEKKMNITKNYYPTK